MTMLHRLLLAAILTVPTGASALAEPPKVVASILPVHSLAAALMVTTRHPPAIRWKFRIFRGEHQANPRDHNEY